MLGMIPVPNPGIVGMYTEYSSAPLFKALNSEKIAIPKVETDKIMVSVALHHLSHDIF